MMAWMTEWGSFRMYTVFSRSPGFRFCSAAKSLAQPFSQMARSRHARDVLFDELCFTVAGWFFAVGIQEITASAIAYCRPDGGYRRRCCFADRSGGRKIFDQPIARMLFGVGFSFAKFVDGGGESLVVEGHVRS